MGMSWINFLGFAAAVSVLASFCMTTIVALRAVALLSNILFISYGLLAHIYPVFFLHAVLLPLNSLKLIRIQAGSWFEVPASSAHLRECEILDTYIDEKNTKAASGL
jgi:hypothetical protein